MDSYFRLVSICAPTVAEKAIDTLSNLDRLFHEDIIISRKSRFPEVAKAIKATVDMAGAAADTDMEDEAFLSLVAWMDNKDNQWWTSFTLNEDLLLSSYLGMPLHVYGQDLQLVEYKYRRGARYLPELRKTEVLRQAFSVLVPEVYTLDVPDLLAVRNSSEFRSFRGEINKVYRELLAAPQHFPDAKSLSEYIQSRHLSELEKLALERRPKPGTVLLRSLFSQVHPIVGLVVGGKEVYEEYKHKYKDWRLAVSALEMKGKLRAIKGRR
jgi:hypothetical protein